MTRKLTLALAAVATLGVAALAPTSASAWHVHGHHHGHWGWGWGGYWGGPTYVAGPDCYIVKRNVQFADGSWHVRRFTVCD